MLRTGTNLSEQLVITLPVIYCIFFGIQHFYDALSGLIDRIKDRLFLFVENLPVGRHELIPKVRQLRNIHIRLILSGNRSHFMNDLFQFTVHDVSLAVLIDIQHFQSACEDFLLLASKEGFDRLIILCEVIERLSHFRDILEEFQRGLYLNDRLHQFSAGFQYLLAGIRMCLILRL